MNKSYLDYLITEYGPLRAKEILKAPIFTGEEVYKFRDKLHARETVHRNPFGEIVEM